eukprot:TRINITY_DN27092_c0_g1_i2.p1 TRINITY_DN27092_c0_g1~~TRINITY_DN27092_c0_g1_i2.p1  ORF type:complete len:158 (-),score=12.48 TRINITY_DN27092_c0_g1_i2:40-513(-)
MRAVSGSRDKTVQVYDLNSMKVAAVLQGHKDAVRCVSVDFGLHRAVSGSTDLGIWDLENSSSICFCKSPSQITAVRANFQEDRIVGGCRRGELCVWDAVGHCLSTLMDGMGEVTAISLDSRAKRVVSASRDGKLRVWDMSTSGCMGVISAPHVISLS